MHPLPNEGDDFFLYHHHYFFFLSVPLPAFPLCCCCLWNSRIKDIWSSARHLFLLFFDIFISLFFCLFTFFGLLETKQNMATTGKTTGLFSSPRTCVSVCEQRGGVRGGCVCRWGWMEGGGGERSRWRGEGAEGRKGEGECRLLRRGGWCEDCGAVVGSASATCLGWHLSPLRWLEDVGAPSLDQPVRSLAPALSPSPSQPKVASGECCVWPLRRCNSSVGWLVGGGSFGGGEGEE